jgi:hypothetical protein
MRTPDSEIRAELWHGNVPERADDSPLGLKP